MNKYAYLIACINNGNFTKLNWLYSVLSLSTQHQVPNYPTPLYRDLTGYYVLDGEDKSYLVDNQDQKCDIRYPLYTLSEPLQLQAGALVNVKEVVDTTVGIVIANAITLIYPFGDKINFVNGGNIMDVIKKELIARLQDDEANDPNGITINEYLKCVNAINDYLSELAPIVTITSTRETITPPPGVHELRDKLLNDYKQAGKDINDPLVYKEIELAMENYAKEYLKNNPAYGNFVSGKIWDIAYKKTNLAKGLEPTFTGGVAPPILSSLSEETDLDPATLVAEANSLRVASYSRAKETVKGGTYGKWLQRHTSSLNIAVDDCGTTQGLTRLYFKSVKSAFTDTSILINGSWVDARKVTFEEGKSYVTRSMMYCKTDNPNHFCKKCTGASLADNPDSLLNAASELAFAMLNNALKKMHSTGIIKVTKIDIDKLLT